MSLSVDVSNIQTIQYLVPTLKPLPPDNGYGSTPGVC